MMTHCPERTGQDGSGKTAVQWTEEKSLPRILKLLHDAPACAE
jgi:hypothetical protein